MQSATGAILSIGLVTGSKDRCEIVMPVANDGGSVSSTNLCTDAIASFVANAMPALLDCISQDTHLVFVQAEAMLNGFIPDRTLFSATANPGTDTQPSLPSRDAALIVMYEEPTDVLPGKPIGVAKNFIPGIAAGSTLGDKVQSALAANLLTFAQLMLTGWAGVAGGNWYRVLKRPDDRNNSTTLKRIAAAKARGQLAVQKKRMFPLV
jgi:hypothetical protein